MRIFSGLVLGAAALAAAVAAGWAFWPSTPGGRADADDARQVGLGKVVYQENCVSCHGANLEGQPDWRTRKPDGRLPAPPHDETGHTWHHPDQQLFRITKLGVKPPLAPEGYQSDMPAFGGVLSDDEIWAVLAFIKSRWPSEVLARQPSPDKGVNR
ncbi:cytochrome c [Tistrella mobilis]|uniref:c-type cytochrome n=1 Tax=Tistrella mobilis TaxID=171437 RepID=UPI003555C17A